MQCYMSWMKWNELKHVIIFGVTSTTWSSKIVKALAWTLNNLRSVWILSVNEIWIKRSNIIWSNVKQAELRMNKTEWLNEDFMNDKQIKCIEQCRMKYI